MPVLSASWCSMYVQGLRASGLLQAWAARPCLRMWSRLWRARRQRAAQPPPALAARAQSSTSLSSGRRRPHPPWRCRPRTCSRPRSFASLPARCATPKPACRPTWRGVICAALGVGTRLRRYRGQALSVCQQAAGAGQSQAHSQEDRLGQRRGVLRCLQSRAGQGALCMALHKVQALTGWLPASHGACVHVQGLAASPPRQAPTSSAAAGRAASLPSAKAAPASNTDTRLNSLFAQYAPAQGPACLLRGALPCCRMLQAQAHRRRCGGTAAEARLSPTVLSAGHLTPLPAAGLWARPMATAARERRAQGLSQRPLPCPAPQTQRWLCRVPPTGTLQGSAERRTVRSGQLCMLWRIRTPLSPLSATSSDTC